MKILPFKRFILIALLYSSLHIHFADSAVEAASSAPQGPQGVTLESLLKKCSALKWVLIDPPSERGKIVTLLRYKKQFLGFRVPADKKIITPGFTTAIVSDDAVSWREVGIHPKGYYHKVIASGEGLIAVGGGEHNNSGSIVFSSNGRDWKVVPLLSVRPPEEPDGDALLSSSATATMPGGLRNVLFGNGIFLSWRGGNMYLSSDKGKSWRKSSSPLTFRELIYAGGAFIGIDASNQIHTSTGGREWVMRAEASPGRVDADFDCVDHACFVIGQQILVAVPGDE